MILSGGSPIEALNLFVSSIDRESADPSLIVGSGDGDLLFFTRSGDGDLLLFTGSGDGDLLLFTDSGDGDLLLFNGSGDGDLLLFNVFFTSLSGKGGGGLSDLPLESPEVVLDLELPREVR